MDPHTQRAEAERWLGIAAKLLTARDFVGSKTFAIRAREADPNNTVVEEILAVVETILASEKRVKISQQHQHMQQQQQQSQSDWYAVLQLPRLVRDAEVISEHYRRLVMCLNPERNRFPFADYALQLVMEAWGVLSDPNKKWLFDSQMALYLQQQSGGGGEVGVGGEVNTFQFLQRQPQSQPQQQSMWQPQPQNQQQMMNQREFISLQSQPAQSQLQQRQQVLPQWQLRGVGDGERNKGVMDEIGEVTRGGRATPITPTIAPGMTPGPPSQPALSMARVAATTRVRSAVDDGNAGNTTSAATCFNNTNNYNNRIDNDRINNNDNGNGNGNDKVGGNINVADDGNNDEDVVEEVDCFWTACPYCFYIFEYQKMYQDCALRCQNCRRGFHAVQIPNPPPISVAASKGGGKEDKGKGNSFCCWGFFPLGFSMMAWRKKNRIGNSTWVPFTPMFTCPVEGGGEGFKWFDNSGGKAFVGPKNGPKKYSPRVYIGDYDEDLVNVSEPSDLDSSDGDWRNPKQKKRRKVSYGGHKRGRPQENNRLKPVTHNLASGGGMSVGGEEMDDDAQAVVIGLAAGGLASRDKSDARTVSAALARKIGRRSVKDVGRLDLNVEFNNDGEDHAPRANAVNGEEERFFDGLEEFLKTLPILDVGGDEKARPSSQNQV